MENETSRISEHLEMEKVPIITLIHVSLKVGVWGSSYFFLQQDKAKTSGEFSRILQSTQSHLESELNRMETEKAHLAAQIEVWSKQFGCLEYLSWMEGYINLYIISPLSLSLTFIVLWADSRNVSSYLCGAEDAAQQQAAAGEAESPAGGAADFEAEDREGERRAGAAGPGGAGPVDPEGRAGWGVCQAAFFEAAGEGRYPDELRCAQIWFDPQIFQWRGEKEQVTLRLRWNDNDTASIFARKMGVICGSSCI